MTGGVVQFAGRIRTQAAGERQALHRHDEPRLVVFLAGEMEEGSFEGTRAFRRGEFVFRPAFFAHADMAKSEGAAYAHLRVSANAARKWIGRHGWCAGTGSVDLERALCGDAVLAQAKPDPYGTAAPGSDMQRAAAMLAAETPVALSEVAALLRLRPHELTRRFSRAHGLSPMTYRRQARLQRAIRMIAEAAGCLSDIAQAAGYSDQSHLCHEVRRETGRTPRALLGG